jgi:hypothetical protein
VQNIHWGTILVLLLLLAFTAGVIAIVVRND